MSREKLHNIISIIGGASVTGLVVLLLFTIWNFSYFILQIDLTLLWFIVVLFFLADFTK